MILGFVWYDNDWRKIKKSLLIKMLCTWAIYTRRDNKILTDYKNIVNNFSILIVYKFTKISNLLPEFK